MPWSCPGCGIEREPAGSSLSTETEYCSEGMPFTPFNNKKCCKCRGKRHRDMCSPCKKRADGGSGSSSKHKQKVSYLNQGLCACGRPRGHAFDPVCSVGGTVAYVSRIGEGKVPAREWVPRAINITKGVIQCASGDEVNGVITLALEERKAAGDPNAAKYERMWGLCTCGDGGAPPEAFDEVATYVAESAEEEGFDKAEEELEAWLEQRMEQHSRRHQSHGRHNRAHGHRRAAAEY